jgi:hypothetical protein
MTLVLSSVSKFGVVMVGDSAITTTHLNGTLPSGDPIPKYARFGAQKVKQVPNRPIGVSFWGMGRIGSIPTDIWLDDFFAHHVQAHHSLDEVCNILADQVNTAFGASGQNDVGGFHVGSIISNPNEQPLPVLYHIHRGHAGQPPGRFQLHKDFPFGQNFSVDQYRRNLELGTAYSLRNGYHSAFAEVQERIFESIYALVAHHDIQIPYPPELHSQERFSRLLVGLMCDLFAMSNRVASVGRPISSLTIDLNGSVTFSSALSNISTV